MQLSQQAFGVAAADAVAGPARRQPPGAAARRGLGRLRAVRRRAGPGPRRRHRRAPGPRRPRRARRPALPVATAARGWTTSTSTSSPASSATRRPSTPARCSGSSRRCATPATSSAAPTASSGCRPRRCASSARRCCATWPTGCPVARASATCARPARPASASGATREWAFGDTEPWDVHPHRRQRRTPDRAPTAATRGDGVRPRRPRHRGDRDRGPHPGRGRAAGRHVVLDGDGRPLGADEAHRAGPAHADPVAVPRRRPAADRLRPARRR